MLTRCNKRRVSLKMRGLIALVAIASAATSSFANVPLLRIESGGHAGAIRAADRDAGGRYLVTAGDDKTARVWDVSTGKLLQVLRPPLDTRATDAQEGVLNAVSLSPDAEVVAASGLNANNDVYVFSRQTGELLHRLTGLPNAVTRLAFAPSGRTLAVGLFGSHGLRLFRANANWTTLTSVGQDLEYASAVQGLSWHPTDASLVVTSADGFVRRYNTTSTALQKTHQQKIDGALMPYRATHSPNGQSLAVGFSDVARVSVLSAETLAVRQSLLLPENLQGSAANVSWSSNGQSLFAAGTLRRTEGQTQRAVLARAEQSEGRFTRFESVANDSVTELLPMFPSGRIVLTGADGTWKLLDGELKSQLGSVRGAIDLRAKPSQVWQLSGDLSQLYLPGDRPLMFDVRQGVLQKGNASGLRAPTQSAGGLTITQWQQSTAPRVNGVVIPLDAQDTALSAAVQSRGEAALVGSARAVRRVERDGKQSWRWAAPAAVWQLAWSADGRTVAAACGDGTVRWLDAATGREQLAAFFHADGARWVAWTPDGFYDASVGGEDLIGWHIDRGTDRSADFFGASRLREKQYRPDRIAEMFGGKVVTAPTPPPAPPPVPELPPVVEIVRPTQAVAAAQGKIAVALRVRSSSNLPLQSIKLRVDGALVQLPALGNLGSPKSSQGESVWDVSIEVPVAPDAQELSFFGQNSVGSSSPAIVRLVPTPVAPPAPAPAPVQVAAPVKPAAPVPPKPAPQPPPAPSPPPVAALPPAVSVPLDAKGQVDLRPVLYILAVGVSDYSQPALKLDFSAKDAKDFTDALRIQEGKLYRKVEVKLLTNKTASRDQVLDGLDWMRRSMTARDVGIVFLAGHGVNDPDGAYYFLPHEADPKRLKSTSIIFTEIKNTLAALPGKALFFVDTCHAGNVLGTSTRSVNRNDITRVVNELSSAENGVLVFAASTGKQLAQESTDWKNGAFTLSLIEGLAGGADFAKSGRVTHKMLDLYVSERVKALTNGTQSPVTIVPQGVPDFPLALVAAAQRTR